MTRRIVLLMVGLMFASQALFFSRVLVFSDDESGYVALGHLAVTGAISLYEDDVAGGRAPLPFLVLGASQALAGRSLWRARLVCIVLSLAVLWLTVRTASRLEGPQCGVLAGLFLATQGTLLGYLSTAGYHAVTALVLLAVLQLFVAPEFPSRNVLGALGAGVLFLTRTHVMPLVPLLVGVALVRSRTWRERWLVAAAGTALPLAFFIADTRHWKLLAHVPGLSPVAARLGYASIFEFRPPPTLSLADQLWALVLLARRYESWAIATAGLVLLVVALRARGLRLPPARSPRQWRFVALVLGCGVGCQFVIFRANFKWTLPYLVSFAPLVATLLALGYTRLLRLPARQHAGVRATTVAVLAVGLTVSVVFVRNPLLPVPAGRLLDDDAVARLERITKRLTALIPAGSRVFLVGESLPLFLADRLPYLRQVITPRAFVPDPRHAERLERSGFWGPREMEKWLGADADYAVIQPAVLGTFRAEGSETVERLEAMLGALFAEVARLDDYPWAVYHVYRRRGWQMRGEER